MKEIKFKVWDNVDYMSTPFTIRDVQDRKIQFTSDCVIRQFTGFKAENGEEIYDGDVLKGTHWFAGNQYVRISSVSWGEYYDAEDSEHIGWIQKYVDDDYPERQLCNELYDGKEIIGNIYQNPELLKPNNP